MDARRAAQRIDHKTGIVGEGRQAGRRGGGVGLDRGILRKGRAGLLRLRQVRVRRADTASMP